MIHWGKIRFALMFLAFAGSAYAAPIGTYYLTDVHSSDISSTLDAIHGNSVVFNAASNRFQEGPIAVFRAEGVLRTTGHASGTFAGYGDEYTGVPGQTVTFGGNFFYNTWGHSDEYYDGTTDGHFNYSVGAFSGAVYASTTTWGGSGTLLFNTGNTGDGGITYDPTNNSLWIQNSNTGVMTNYALNGAVLSSFNVLSYNHYAALAMDVDHTLWFSVYNSAPAGDFLHYSTDGTFLGAASYAGVDYLLGGEIALDLTSPVPEPGTMTLAGLGAIGLVGGVVRRRRQHSAPVS